MGDLTIETATYCASAESFETEMDGHKIRWERVYGRGYQYDWTCTCPKGKGGLCKHIKTVKMEGLRCGWNEELEPTAKPAPDGTCPDCGGPTKSTRVGV